MAQSKRFNTPFHVPGYTDKAIAPAGDAGVYDRHTTPVMSHPRDRGAGVVPDKFFETMKGSPAALASPLGTSLPNPKHRK